jgi:phage protein U
MAVFALLGNIVFRVVGSPDAIESSRRYDYAEHRVLEARPRLQWVGPGLERIELEALLHESFTRPALQLARLGAAAAAHRALALVFGSGEFRGYFVIESITTRSTQHAADGRPIAIRLAVRLREWATEREPAAPPRAAIPPIGIAALEPLRRAGEPGVSALLRNRAVEGKPTAEISPDNVSIAQITRSAAA